MAESVLAIDLGASSGRVVGVALTANKLTLSELHRFETPHLIEGGYERWNAPALLNEIQHGVAKSDGALSAGVDTWGVDFGLLNEAGALIANPIRYRDHSHQAGFEELHNRLDKQAHYKNVGIQPLPFNTAAQLLARKLRNDNELRQASTLAFMPDLIAQSLCESPTIGAEATIASTSEMIALSGGWDTNVLNKIGLDESFLPKMRNAKAEVGKTAQGLKILAVASHDTASAVVACPATNDDWAFISSGTWSIVGIESATPYSNEAAMNANFSNEGGYANTYRFLKNCSGLWLLQQSQRSRSTTECVSMASAAKPFGAKFDVNHPSLLNPEDMPTAIRSISDKTIADEAELFRAIFENLAANYARIITELETIAGRPISEIHLVGGGSQNALLNQMTADATSKTVLAGPTEATALGNALVQFEALGLISNARTDGRALIHSSEAITPYEPKIHQRWLDWMAD